MKDWRGKLAGMIAACAEQAKSAMVFGGEMTLACKPAAEGAWGEIRFIGRGEPVPSGFELTELTLKGSDPYDHYETRIHGCVYRLPVIGADDRSPVLAL